MINMKMSAEEASEYSPTAMSEAPIYPYGLRIHLDDDALKKLGMPALPAVDQTMMISCRVLVVGVSSNQTQGGDREDCVQLQITDMEIGPDNSGKSAAEKLYGG